MYFFIDGKILYFPQKAFFIGKFVSLFYYWQIVYFFIGKFVYFSFDGKIVYFPQNFLFDKKIEPCLFLEKIQKRAFSLIVTVKKILFLIPYVSNCQRNCQSLIYLSIVSFVNSIFSINSSSFMPSLYNFPKIICFHSSVHFQCR